MCVRWSRKKERKARLTLQSVVTTNERQRSIGVWKLLRPSPKTAAGDLSKIQGKEKLRNIFGSSRRQTERKIMMRGRGGGSMEDGFFVCFCFLSGRRTVTENTVTESVQRQGL